MTDSKAPAPVGTGAADKQTVPRGNERGRLIRRHRRHCREVDRAIEDIYGAKPHYPDPAA